MSSMTFPSFSSLACMGDCGVVWVCKVVFESQTETAPKFETAVGRFVCLLSRCDLRTYICALPPPTMPQGNNGPYTFDSLCYRIHNSTSAKTLEALHCTVASELALRQSQPEAQHHADFSNLNDREMLLILGRIVSAIMSLLSCERFNCSELRCAGRHSSRG